MNINRINLEVGSRHFSANPAGALHRAVNEASLGRLRRELAVDAIEQWDGASRISPAMVAWRVTVGASQAARTLRKLDNAIDAVFGSCLAHRSRGRPAWESEGFLAQLGKVPLQGLTLLGASLGKAYAAVSGEDKYYAAAKGARLGTLVGGAVAYAWSQGLALTGFAAKMATRIPFTLYLGLVRVFEPMDKELTRDALFGTASKLHPLRSYESM